MYVSIASDRRLWSSLWELYSIVKSFRSPFMPVCVVVLCDDDTMWPALATLASRQALPPGGTRAWPPERRWADCTSLAAATGLPQDQGQVSTTLKSPIRVASGSVVRSRGAGATEYYCGESEVRMEVKDSNCSTSDSHSCQPHHCVDACFDWEGLEEDRLHVAMHGETQSHGFGVVQDCSDSPPLETIHHGPWRVLPIDSLTNAQDALLAFTWLASVLDPQPEQSSPDASPRPEV